MTSSIPAAPLATAEQNGLVTTLAAIAFLLGTAAVVRGNAAQTLLPSIVASDDLERAKGGAPKTSWAESSAHPWPAP